MHDIVDLRSDTLTLPTPAMREAMARAEVGHDVQIHQIGPGAIRCVTHKDVDREDIDRALDAFREITSTW